MKSFEKTRSETRSPVPENALPHAGESLGDEYYNRKLDILYWAVVAGIAALFCWEEWVQYLAKTPPSPWLATLLFVVAAAVSGRKIWTLSRDLPNLKLGAHGERIVGEKLEALRAAGYRVFHDVQEDDYNIDHVLIGPGGVFAIETKTRSKGKGQTVTYDGKSVLVNGFTPDRDPITQSFGVARRLRAILKEETGSDVRVQPVVLYPGWFVTASVRDPDVIVANESYFTAGLQRSGQPVSLDKKEIDFLAAGMERYLRRPRPE